MIRKILFITLFVVIAQAGKVVELTEKYKNSERCKACHGHIVQMWKNSWHAKSHYEKDEYFRKSLDYVARKTRRAKNAIKVECAACHNPRITVTQTDINYEIMALMKLDKNSKVNKAVVDDALSEGINCLVCHNIDKIDDNLDKTKRGVHRVEWVPQGTMVGPFDDAKSPYHKTVMRDHFHAKVNRLCFVCHANDHAEKGLVFTDMESEYKSKKKCVECHMSPKVKKYASTYKLNGKVKPRLIRNHFFYGGHIEKMHKGALGLGVKKVGKNLIVSIKNANPHNIPSGFGARELIVDLEYKADGKTLKKLSTSLTRKYISRRGKATIPHLAVKQSKDMSVPANGVKKLKFPLLKGAKSVTVRLYYRLVNDEVRSILKLQDPIWSKKMFIDEAKLQL